MRVAFSLQHAFLRLFYKLFLTFWAGNRDLTLAPGNSDRLPTPGTIKVPMVFIFYSVQQPEIFSVFLVPLVGVSGKCPENCPTHAHVRKRHQNQLQKRAGKQHLQNAGNQTRKQNCRIQFIGAVAPLHKVPGGCRNFCAQRPQPIAKTVHKFLLT
jgi:hypothetical protein